MITKFTERVAWLDEQPDHDPAIGAVDAAVVVYVTGPAFTKFRTPDVSDIPLILLSHYVGCG